MRRLHDRQAEGLELRDRDNERLAFRAASLLKQLHAAEDGMARLQKQLERQAARRQTELEAQDAATAELRREITLREAALASCGAGLAARDDELAALRRSTSWRVTAPLRGLRNLLAAWRTG